jgi:hypothetical protein
MIAPVDGRALGPFGGRNGPKTDRAAEVEALAGIPERQRRDRLVGDFFEMVFRAFFQRVDRLRIASLDPATKGNE